MTVQSSDAGLKSLICDPLKSGVYPRQDSHKIDR